jgi:hypothetical protein
LLDRHAPPHEIGTGFAAYDGDGELGPLVRWEHERHLIGFTLLKRGIGDGLQERVHVEVRGHRPAQLVQRHRLP